jgi:predicted phage terminase large subunit-like protein
LYGGAAGGGKSDALLMAALQYVQVPGYAALILRRSYADLSLPDAIMDRAGQWLKEFTESGEVHWDKEKKTFTFPSGATLTFGYLKNEGDEQRYQGPQFQFVGFDEVTQFTKKQYTGLFHPLRRREGADVPVRMRCASNPGGLGHRWAKARFVTGDKAFIPAKLEDNPHLDEEYERNLKELDPVRYRQLREGDWDARADGKMFKRDWFEIVNEGPAEFKREVRFWDMAATEDNGKNDPDFTVGLRLRLSHEGQWYVMHVTRFQKSPLDTERSLRQTAQIDGPDVSIVMEQEGGASGKIVISQYQQRVVPGFDLTGKSPKGDKVVRAKAPASAAQAGNVKLVKGSWNEEFLDELEAFPTKGVHDDQVDSFSGAMRELTDIGEGAAARNTHRSAPEEPVYRVGDLELVGEQYVDEET